MAIRFRTKDEPAKTRLDFWQHLLSSSLASYQIRTLGGPFRGQIHQAEIGSVTVLGLQGSAQQASRTPDLIRKSDLDLCKIDLAIGGAGVFEQDGRESRLTPGEFVLMDLSRPSHVAIEKWHESSIVMFPRGLLPVRHNDIRELTAVRFSPRDPYAALVTSLVQELTRHLDAYESARDARIGAAFLDLLALAIATRLDRLSGMPAESRQNAMTLRIQAFIEHHLGDPDLSPGMIAAAHHISIRTLHKLYEAEEHTLSASIRYRRLERCRQNLLDPGLRDRPVSAVGARWGFQDAAAFSRAFRAAYGVAPGEYRAIQLGVGAPGPDGGKGMVAVQGPSHQPATTFIPNGRVATPEPATAPVRVTRDGGPHQALRYGSVPCDAGQPAN
jgi:AraC-like DNA-binding protein